MALKRFRPKTFVFLSVLLAVFLLFLGLVYADTDDENSKQGDSQETSPDLSYLGGLIYLFRSEIDESFIYFMLKPLGRANAYIALANKRLDEFESLIEKEGFDEDGAKFLAGLLNRYFDKIKEAVADNDEEDIEEKISREELKAKVMAATSKHIEVLYAVLDKVPDEAKAAIEHAIAVSQKGGLKAIESIGKPKNDKDDDENSSDEDDISINGKPDINANKGLKKAEKTKAKNNASKRP
jgi:formate dehydrogenase maturation protein FdhE